MDKSSIQVRPISWCAGGVFVVCMAVLIPSLPLAAQRPAVAVSFTHLTTENGLSNSRVRSFFQDSKGIVWVGTEAGLNRYDASNFTVFEHLPANPGSIVNNIIPAILEDSRKNFWIGTKKGLQLLDKDKNIFFPDPEAGPNPLGNIGPVLTLYEGRDSNIWVGTTLGLFRLTINTNKAFSSGTLREAAGNGSLRIRHFGYNPQNNNGLSNNLVWSIVGDRDGNLWIGTGRGLNRFDPATNTIERWPSDSNRKDAALSTATVNALLEDKAGYLWAGTANGLYRLSPDRKTATVFKAGGNRGNGPGNNFITEMVEDRWGNIWIGSDGGGLDMRDPQSGKFFHYRHDPNDPGSLSDNNIETLYEDRNGGLWIGNHKGISYLNHHQKPFRLYRNKGIDNSLTPGMITCFWERPDGKVWIGVDDGGMDLFDRNSGSFVHYKHKPGNAQSICDDDVVSVLEDSRGEVWVGTWGGGLTRYRPNAAGGGVFSHYAPDAKPGSIGDDDIWTIYEDKKGDIWIGTVDDGLNRYDRATDAFQSYRWKTENQSVLFRNWVFGICEDNKGNMWIGTADGIRRLVRETGDFVWYPIAGIDKLDHIRAIHQNSAGGFWLGSDIGLLSFDPEKETAKLWQEQDGLADNLVNSIVEDRHGNLWLGTGKGISKFDPKTETFRNYDAHDGLQSGEFSKAHLKSRSGELFFGGINGFNVFHPDSIRDNPNIPPIVITDLKLFNQSVPLKGSAGDTLTFASPLENSILNTSEIRLPYWQNEISFEFAALNYLSPEKNQFRYQLEGYKDDWVETKAGRNFANYTGLSPGTYIFRVIGSNNDGVWNEQGAAIKIIVFPPWWRTWWAYILYALLLGSLFYFLRRYELRRQHLKYELELEHREAEQLKELDKTKSRLYANITHEFRTPLTVILGMAELLEKELEQLKTGKSKRKSEEKSASGTRPDSPGLTSSLALIRRNGSHLLTLVNQMLDLSRLESNRMEVKFIQADIVAYVNYITESFHSMAEAKDLIIKVNSAPESIVMDYDPGKILQIVSNLLSNAIKFTPPGGEIEVRLTVDGGRPTADDALTISRLPSTVYRPPSTVYRPPSTVLTVCDTGVGIPPDHLPHIFDRFYQVAEHAATGAEPGGGTGIGLALVQELVKLFKGSISVESKLGKGTTFTVVLPIYRNAQVETKDTVLKPLPLEEYTSESTPEFSKIKKEPQEADTPLLLIIEDNPDVRVFLISSLEQQYRIETAVNGQAGIEKAIEIVPDIIISDVMMPEKDGFEVCDTLKKNMRTSHIPIVMLTARATVEDRVAGLERGADAYIVKPFHQAELIVQLQNLLDSRRRLQDRYRQLETPVAQAGPDEKIEDAFLMKLRRFIEDNINNAELSIDDLCRHMAMSRMQLHRKIKALTDRSTALYIRSIRLQRARHLLSSFDLNVSEAAYKVGFDDPKYFSRVFTEEFGVAPSEVKSDVSKKSVTGH